MINFDKGDGLIPVIIQDYNTMQVLMLGYMNHEAWEKTLASGMVTFYSRSKNRLWTKGETSGNYLRVQSHHFDCDNDTLLIKAKPDGPCCHTGSTTCFNTQPDSSGFIFKLENIITQKISGNDDKSYTRDLYKKGINKIAQKVGEEAVELVIEAKDNNMDLFKNEAADLLFHYLILLKAKNCTLGEIEQILYTRSLQKD